MAKRPTGVRLGLLKALEGGYRMPAAIARIYRMLAELGTPRGGEIEWQRDPKKFPPD